MIYPAGLHDKFTFGKHKGKTVEQVCVLDPSYIRWVDDEIEDFDLTQEAWDCHTDNDVNEDDEHTNWNQWSGESKDRF